MCFLLRVLPVDLRGAAGIYTRGKVDGYTGGADQDGRRDRGKYGEFHRHRQSHMTYDTRTWSTKIIILLASGRAVLFR